MTSARCRDHVDDPAISMTIGTNTSPMIGKIKGHKLTARMVKDRLDRELVGNVSLKIARHRPPRRVGGAGPRRAGARHPRRADAPRRLRAHRRQADSRHQAGRRQDARAVSSSSRSTCRRSSSAPSPSCWPPARAAWRACPTTAPAGCGWSSSCPPAGSSASAPSSSRSPAAPGSPTRSLTATTPGPDRSSRGSNGSIVADRAGVVTPFAIVALQERMTFFVEPTQEVYEGMVVGENSRADDMDVNITKEKKLTNMRQSTSDEFERMTPSRRLTLEESPRVRPRRRVRRGHPGVRPHPQGGAGSELARSARRRTSSGPTRPESALPTVATEPHRARTERSAHILSTVELND